ncbi:MAG: acyl CoA:acetate/3-ketoacid CoA transferase [Clostridia bacterium]|nr:acyl CoA:acetate/3-ketoacid CoA transferase [Clostridia bacterium]
MNKIITAQAAAQWIQDNRTVWLTAGGGGINEPSTVLKAIEDRFLQTGHPANLVLSHAAGIGDKCGGGADRFAHEGMVRKVIGSHWVWSVNMQELARQEKIEAYVLPQGTMSQLVREIAGGRPGVLTKVGLGTFVDPRVEGGAMNARSGDKLTELVTLGGEEYLLYKSFPVDVALIRATTADEEGNLTFEHEGILAEGLAAAQAARNSGGVVIAQVERAVEKGTLRPMDIRIPGILVDAVVVDPGQRMSLVTEYDPSLSGECRMLLGEKLPAMPLSERKIIARRAALEIRQGNIVNLGFGVPAGVASVMHEEGQDGYMKLSVEQGITGGIPSGGSNFGLVYNPEVIIDAPSQFDWYDGGGLDVAILSFAEFDRQGNVNVSRFGDRVNGVGGFINISQSARKVIFTGTFTTGGLSVDCEDGALHIRQEGRVQKAVEQVAQISFSGSFARRSGQQVLFVTERAVFELCEQGVVLKEYANGLDVRRDILDQMAFAPVIDPNLRKMPACLFRQGRMDCFQA